MALIFKKLDTADYAVYNEEIFMGYIDLCEDGFFRLDESSEFWRFLPSALHDMALNTPEEFERVIIMGLKASIAKLEIEFCAENCPPSDISESGQ